MVSSAGEPSPVSRPVEMDMQHHSTERRIGRVTVRLPTGGLQIHFDIPGHQGSIDPHRGLGKIRPRPAVPVSELHNLHAPSIRGGELASQLAGKPSGLPGQFITPSGGFLPSVPFRHLGPWQDGKDHPTKCRVALRTISPTMILGTHSSDPISSSNPSCANWMPTGKEGPTSRKSISQEKCVSHA